MNSFRLLSIQNLGQESKTTKPFLNKNVKCHFDVSVVFFKERSCTWKYKLFRILFILHNFLFHERILVLLPSKTDKIPCVLCIPCVSWSPWQSMGLSMAVSIKSASLGKFFWRFWHCGDYTFHGHTASLILTQVLIKACRYSWTLDKAGEWDCYFFKVVLIMKDCFTGILKTGI